MSMSEGSTFDVSSDQMGEPAWFSAPLIWLATGLIIGAVLGGLYAAARPAPAAAVTSLALLSDSQALSSSPAASSSSSSTDDPTSFIQGELVVINGHQLRQQVQRTLKLATLPDTSATQIGSTSVVSITAKADNSADAVRIAAAMDNAYTRARVSELQGDVRSALTQVRTQVVAIKAEIASSTGNSSSITALQSQYETLLDELSTLQVAQAGIPQAVQTLQPAIADVGGLPSWAKDVGALAIVGAIVALIALFVTRRVRPRINSIEDIGAVGVRPLLPSVSHGGGELSRRNEPSARPLRSLAARLAPGANAVLVGTTSGVGTSYVTAAIAAQIAETRNVLLILASDASDGRGMDRMRLGVAADAVPAVSLTAVHQMRMLSDVALPTAVQGLWVLPAASMSGDSRTLLPALRTVIAAADAESFTILIDSPSLDRSSLGVELARMVDGAILVVGRKVSAPVDLISAMDILESRDVPVAGAVINDVHPGRRLTRTISASLSRMMGRRTPRSSRPTRPTAAVRILDTPDQRQKVGLSRGSQGSHADRNAR